MSIPVSSAPTLKANLVAAITAKLPTAAPGEALPLVSYDAPGTYQPGDIISVGDVISRQVQQQQMVGSGGAGWLDELYVVEVTVDCFRGGDYAQTVAQRAWALVAVVESAVRSDPTVSGAVLEAWPSGARSQSNWESTHKGRRCRIAVDVTCHTVI